MKSNGFTIIEIMVVLVILSILATMVVPKIMDRPDKARVTKAIQDISSIEQSLKLYKLDKHKYPSTKEGLQSLVPKYLDKVPSDPWGNSFLYISPGTNGDYDLVTYGADGKRGGDDLNEDISNWSIK